MLSDDHDGFFEVLKKEGQRNFVTRLGYKNYK